MTELWVFGIKSSNLWEYLWSEKKEHPSQKKHIEWNYIPFVTEHKKLYDWHNNFSPAGLLLCPKDFKIAMIFGLWENKIATICYVLFLKNHLQLKKKVKAVTNPYSWVQIGNYLYNFIILINNYHFYVQVNVYSIF